MFNHAKAQAPSQPHVRIHAMTYLLRNQAGGAVVNTILAVVFVLGLSLYWQFDTDRTQQQQAEITETTYVSPGNEFQIDIPTSWGVGEETFEEDGVVSIELYGPRNTEINAAFRQKEGVESESIEDALTNSRITELLDSSVGREFALLQITVTTATFFELYDSKQTFRDDILSDNTTASGIRYSEFEDFNTEGADGWVYDVTLFQENAEITATSYFLLGELAEVDVLLYPADTNFKTEAEEILKSLRIDTLEQN